MGHAIGEKMALEFFPALRVEAVDVYPRNWAERLDYQLKPVRERVSAIYYNKTGILFVCVCVSVCLFVCLFVPSEISVNGRL